MNDVSSTTARMAPKPVHHKPSLLSMLQRPMAKYVLFVLIFAAVAAALYFFYANRPLRVEIANVEHDVAIRVFGLGKVEARIRSDIGFEVGATLVELNADHGDRVNKGDVLARLSPGEQEAKVAKAQAALAIAKTNIAKSMAILAKAHAVYAQRKTANERKQVLVQRKVISREAAEEAEREEGIAKADVLVAESEVEVANASLSDAQAQLRLEETMLEHRTLVAPYDAIVLARRKELGSVVKSGEAIFSIMAVNSYWGLAYVDEAQAGSILEGQKVEARIRSRPRDTFTGEVARIGLESDPVTEERRVYVTGDSPPDRIFVGEQAEFWIQVAQLEEALLVPEAAVREYDGITGKLWIVEDGKLRQRVVRFGHRTENARLEIVGGLPDDANVVVRHIKGMREGRLVQIAQGGGE